MDASRLSGTRALVVEDEKLLRKRIAGHLGRLGVDVTAVADLAEARRVLADLDFDLALLDINLPDGRSLSLLSEKVLPSKVAAVMMTAEGGVDGAVEAMRLGAADYLVKPFELDELAVRLARARRDRQGKRRDSFRREEVNRGGEFFFSAALEPLRRQMEKIVSADQRLQQALPPVLIEGETGTGKTSLARWLHHHGSRAEGPLVEVNCSAVPDTLAESELFGHERGAFTDAREPRMGLMEAAEGGTLFLDELPSLSLAVQAKLLTAIEDRFIRRVGGTRSVPVDVRIITAASSNLRELVAAGRFREDLMHRLDLFRVRLPPLRERGQDILALAEVLISRIGRNYGLPPLPLPPLGRERILGHRWPGNVRELAHEIERSLVFDQDRLTFASLTPSVEGGAPPWLNPGFSFPPDGISLEGAIDELVDRALKQTEGNVTAAARLLRMPRDFVRYRLKMAAKEKGREPVAEERDDDQDLP